MILQKIGEDTHTQVLQASFSSVGGKLVNLS